MKNSLNQKKELIDKALELKEKKNFREALDILEELLGKDPNSEKTKEALIKVLLDYGAYLNDEWVLGYDKAVICYKRITDLDPNNHRAWYNLGISYFNLNKTEEALNAYNRAIQIKPDYMYCYYNIGLLYEVQKGELEIALQYYEKALKYNNNFTYALQAARDVRQKLEFLKISESDNELGDIGTKIICKKCGNVNRIGAKFCDKCGEPI